MKSIALFHCGYFIITWAISLLPGTVSFGVFHYYLGLFHYYLALFHYDYFIITWAISLLPGTVSLVLFHYYLGYFITSWHCFIGGISLLLHYYLGLFHYYLELFHLGYFIIT